MADSTDEESPECRVCGTAVAQSTEQRVVTTVEDGAAVHRHFCSDECLEVWEAEN